jgi:hypothetical protein
VAFGLLLPVHFGAQLRLAQRLFFPDQVVAQRRPVHQKRRHLYARTSNSLNLNSTPTRSPVPTRQLGPTTSPTPSAAPSPASNIRLSCSRRRAEGNAPLTKAPRTRNGVGKKSGPRTWATQQALGLSS